MLTSKRPLVALSSLWTTWQLQLYPLQQTSGDKSVLKNEIERPALNRVWGNAKVKSLDESKNVSKI